MQEYSVPNPLLILWVSNYLELGGMAEVGIQFVCVRTNWCHFAYSHFAYLLPLGAISPTHAKWDQINVKQKRN